MTGLGENASKYCLIKKLHISEGKVAGKILVRALDRVGQRARKLWYRVNIKRQY